MLQPKIVIISIRAGC